MSLTEKEAAAIAVAAAVAENSIISSSSSSSSSAKSVKLKVPIDKDGTYKWQNPSKFWYYLLCFGGCGLNYTTQCVLCAVCTGSIVFGFNLSLLNTSVGTIGGYFEWCGNQYDRGCNDFKLKSAFIQVAVFVGAAVGAMSAGGFMKAVGCRSVFFVADIIITVGIVFSCVAQGFASLLVARLVVGVGVGVLAVSVPTYIAEVTPPSSRGAYGVLHQLLITVGILIGVLLGIPFSVVPEDPTAQLDYKITTFDKVWWRVMLGLGIIPIIAQFALYTWVFSAETPFYLIGHDKFSEAYCLMQKLAGKSDVDADFSDVYDAAVQTDSGEGPKGLGDVWRDHRARRAIVVGSAVSALQQFTGINVFITNSNKLFAEAGLDQDLVTILSIVLTAVNFLMTFPAIYMIEALGRKTSLLLGTAGMGLGVIPGGIMLLIEETVAASWVAIAGAIIFIIFFSCTWGPVVWVYIFEILPGDVKDAAAGFMTAINWISGIAMVFAGSWMPTGIAYVVFFGFNIIGFLFVLFFMKETKGRAVGDSPYFSDD